MADEHDEYTKRQRAEQTIARLQAEVEKQTQWADALNEKLGEAEAEVKKLSALLTERNRDLEDAIRALRAAPGDERGLLEE
jgi:peptidoglycan hydrolase CwlO-like protein